MRLFLDSADIDEIQELTASRAVRGVTTNPSLIAKTSRLEWVEPGKQYDYLLQEIARTINNPNMHLSVEPTSIEPHLIELQADGLHTLLKGKAHIKVPVTIPNLAVITRLAHAGVKVNATACMTALQAKMASDAGADLVSFFYNRMIDGIYEYEGRNVGGHEIAMDEIKKYVSMGDVNAAVICGSIRRPSDVYECWTAGAAFVTAPGKIIRQMIEHPKTAEAIKQFKEDIDKWQG